jgi:hypothetical protein
MVHYTKYSLLQYFMIESVFIVIHETVFSIITFFYVYVIKAREGFDIKHGRAGLMN